MFKKIKVLIIASAAATYDHQSHFTHLAKYKDLDINILISPYWTANNKLFYKKEDLIYAERFDYNNKSGYNLIKKTPLFVGKSYHIYLGLWKLLFKLKPDIIDVIFEPWNWVLTQVILWKNLFSKKTKITFYSHENIYKTYSNRLLYNLVQYGLIEKYNIKNVNGCVGATNQILGVMKKKGIRCKTIVNGDEIDPTIFKKKNVSRLKKKLNLNTFTIGYSGRLIESKGIMTLIEAAGKIKKEDFKILICGWGEQDYIQKIIDKAKHLEIYNKIVLIQKKLGRKMVDYYNAMDVIVVPSLTTRYWKEQFGRVNIEAMACGTPVIGSNSGGILEVVNDAGLIFKESNSEDLKENLLKVMKNKKLLNELSKKSIKRVLNNFTAEKKAEKTYKFYQELLK